MDWEKLLAGQYREDLSDEGLVDEALFSAERTFELMDKNELMHHSRTMAILYLALKAKQ